MSNLEGFYKGLEVLSSPFVDEDHVYLMNPKQVVVMTNVKGFEPVKLRHKLKRYFKNLWRALLND